MRWGLANNLIVMRIAGGDGNVRCNDSVELDEGAHLFLYKKCLVTVDIIWLSMLAVRRSRPLERLIKRLWKQFVVLSAIVAFIAALCDVADHIHIRSTGSNSSDPNGGPTRPPSPSSSVYLTIDQPAANTLTPSVFVLSGQAVGLPRGTPLILESCDCGSSNFQVLRRGIVVDDEMWSTGSSVIIRPTNGTASDREAADGCVDVAIETEDGKVAHTEEFHPPLN
jgi:hypothetical protein